MYLSKVDINPARRSARYLLASPQRLHAAVLAGFPPDEPLKGERGERVLWRIDRWQSAYRLYVVSPGKGDFTHLAEQAGWPVAGCWATRNYEPVLRNLTLSQELRFRLTANPTHSSSADASGGRGKIYAHVTADQQLMWLKERAPKCGIDLHQVNVVARDQVDFRRGKQRVTLARATYEGILRITDTGELRHTMVAGLGRAKAYGCGLLTLAALGQ